MSDGRNNPGRQRAPRGWPAREGKSPTDAPRGAEEPAAAADELERVRGILLGPERDRLRDIEARLENPAERAKDVSEVLSQAVHLSTTKNDALARSLRPTIEASLTDSARRNPRMLADAIFPVLGPAIRKSITATFQELVQSLQTTLELSTSPRSWRWRLEAARTGRSFAEVVLYHTLVYRTEQIFFIHNPSGLLLHHVTGASVTIKDEHTVSAMLTAIQDFLRDSFAEEGSGLQTLQMNDLQVWIETAPHATLACVIRGVAPVAFRREMQKMLEEIHGEYETALRLFDGDTGVFAECEPQLEKLRRTEVSNDAGSSGKRPSFTAAYVLIGSLALVATLWFGRRSYEERRWQAAFTALRAEPGIVISDIGKVAGRYQLTGLRDPLALDPQVVFRAQNRDPASLDAIWEPYHSLAPEFILHRAHTLMEPPPGIILHLADAVLNVTGPAAAASWLDQARAADHRLAGVDRIVFAIDENDADQNRAGLPDEFDQFQILFDDDTAFLDGQQRKLARLVNLLKTVADEGRRSAVAQVILRGHTRPRDSRRLELQLSRERAAAMRDWLLENGVARRLLVVQPAGASMPAEDGQHDRVGFKVRLK